MQKFILIIILSVLSTNCFSEQLSDNTGTPIEHKPIIRVILDNDFGGDPDGLFQLAHQLLSPSNEVKGIIASQHYQSGFYGAPGTAAHGKIEADKLIKVLNLHSKVTVVEGAAKGIEILTTPQESEGANLIIREAMKDDPRPLYILCGAGLTTIASAFKKEPKISKRIKLVWIGGPEYDGMALPPPNSKGIEYNLGIDVLAAQIIFNESDIEVWQIPRNVYRQAIVSDAELSNRLLGNRRRFCCSVKIINTKAFNSLPSSRLGLHRRLHTPEQGLGSVIKTYHIMRKRNAPSQRYFFTTKLCQPLANSSLVVFNALTSP